MWQKIYSTVSDDFKQFYVGCFISYLFFLDKITYRRAIGEREIKYHFISPCSKGTALAQRAIKLTLLTAHYFIAR